MAANVGRTSKSRATGTRTGEPRNAANASGGSKKVVDTKTAMSARKGCSIADAFAYIQRSKNDVIPAAVC